MILPLGPQNAFVLNQGIRRQYHLMIASLCALSDIVLICAGAFVVLGSLGGQLAETPKRAFALGTISASILWFFGLALLAAWLAPRLRTEKAQRIINGIVGLVMWFIAFQLGREGVAHINVLL